MDSNLINQIFDLQLKHKFVLKSSDHSYRISKLLEMKRQILSHQDEILQAMDLDFGKARLESTLSEILPLIAMINLYVKNLKKWMKPKKVKASLLFMGTKNTVIYEAKGNCLVISPWNYPFQLALYPLLTAFAAGNTVILKPSEFTPHTNKIIKKLIELVFLPEEVSQVEGEVEVSNLLLEKPFDHIFFTGSTAVGKIVMEKASKHLASVALELGGKSPVIIDSQFPIAKAAKNIAWGKYVNCGQTCVAPDYILLPKGSINNFVTEFSNNLKTMYAHQYEKNDDYCRIITPRHGQRLKSLVDQAISQGATLLYGGELFSNGKMMPTVLSGVNKDMEIMKEEIFGPLLPVVEYENLDEAISFVNSYDNSLALYLFSFDQKNINKVRQNTNSGGYSINETLLHVAQSYLPFGGAGKSGIGKYHGVYGFEEMSNARSVLHRKFSAGTEYFYPPYTPTKQALMDKVIQYFNRFL